MHNPKIWAEAFIEECVKQGVDSKVDIIAELDSNTHIEKSKMYDYVHSILDADGDEEWREELKASCLDCKVEKMYDSNSKEYYCPLCDS